MSILVGIDEVGYGPKLGPLVVCAYAFRVPDPAIDLWKALAPVVRRQPLAGTLAVADSKELYTPARGIGSLEPAALAFLSVLPGADVGSLRALASRVILDGEASFSPSPWYRDTDVRLPLASDPVEIDALAAGLWTASLRAGVMPAGCRAAWTEPAPFNAAVSSTANKSDLLFTQACALVRDVLDSCPADDVTVFAGKQGGRRFYLPGLIREFGTVSVLREETGTSVYEWKQRRRNVRMSFLVNGEMRHFGIALASMIGKYLREVGMKRFNEWWAGHLPKLRPTAGYGTDGGRFFRAVQPEFERLELHPDQVLRKR